MFFTNMHTQVDWIIYIYIQVHNVRSKMVSILREKFAHLNLTFSIGGQISFDVSSCNLFGASFILQIPYYESVIKSGLIKKELENVLYQVFPQGWDKTYCLKYLDEFSEIHFFGDKTYKVPT